MAIWTKARWVAAALPAYEVTDEAMKRLDKQPPSLGIGKPNHPAKEAVTRRFEATAPLQKPPEQGKGHRAGSRQGVVDGRIPVAALRRRAWRAFSGRFAGTAATASAIASSRK
jgi:hypothetical protein